ncbi:unnamed protein product [Effrenium voratum]|nr:unnamed protein product [Effrenium voratum]
MHSMPEDEGCNWPSAADSRPAWAEMSAMPQYPMPKGQEMTKGKEHWRKLRAKYGTAAAFEQLLQQVRADNTQALYEDDWAKRGVSRIPTEMSRAPTNMTRHNSVGGGNTEARAEARKVPSPDPEEMFQPLSEDENDSVGTGEDHQYGKNWQKVRRALGAAAAFNGLLQDVRESQANSLYERDWNRPQFGGSAKLMGHRMPTQFLGPGLRTVTGDSMLGQRSAKLGVRAKSQKIAAVANAGEDVSMSRAKSQKVASFASFGDAEGPLVPGASAARNSGGAQKAFGEEREAREREGGGSRNYAQKATAIFGAGDFDALSPGSGSPTSSVASPKAKDPKSAISRQPSRKNASKVMVRTVSEEDQAIAEAAARKAAADAANEAPNREDKATPRSIAEHTARAAGASSRGAPATQSGRSQPSERSEQLGRGEAAKGDALRFDRANVAPSSGRGSERPERSGELKGDALRFDRATQRRGESKGDSKFERVQSNQSQQSPQTPHRTVAERAAAERLRANGGSGDSSKFDRAHSQQSQQSPQTPHRTVAERAAEERLRANGGSGDSSKFDRAQSQQSQPSPQTPHRTVAERAAEASRLNAASGELRGEGYKFGGPAQPRAAERVAGSGDLSGEGYKFGGSGASGSRGGSGSGTAAANAEGKGKGKEAKPQAQRFSMGSDSDAEEMQPYASVPSDGASFSRKPSVALTVKEGEMDDMTREKSIVIAKAAKTPSLSAANARKVKEASELPEAEEGQLVEAPAEMGSWWGRTASPW